MTVQADCNETALSLPVASEGDKALRRQVNDLLLLGDSILAEDQIEPATGSWVQTQKGRPFLLEAGERRCLSLMLEAV